MLSQQEPKMIKPRNYNFKCEKCGKAFETARNLKRHTEKKNACELYNNKVEEAVIQTDIIENSVSIQDIKGLNDKIDALTNTVNHQSQQIYLLIEMMRELKSTPVSTEIPTVSTPVSMEIPTVSTPVSTEIPTVSTPVSTEIPTISTPVSMEIPTISTPEPLVPIKKVKKIKKANAIEPLKPRLKYVFPTEEKEKEQEKEQEKEPLPIHPELKTYLNNLNERFKNSTPPIELATEQIYYNNDTIFEFNHETEKIVICEEELDGFIERCETVEKQLDWYFQLFVRGLNFTTGFHYDAKTNRLYSLGVNKKWEWNESSLINKIRCGMYDTINTAVANSGVVYKSHTDRLFAVKRLAYHKDINAELNEKLLELLKIHFQDRRING